MAGDATLFMRACVEAAWEFVTPILESWNRRGSVSPEYRAGTWGPLEGDKLIEPTASSGERYDRRKMSGSK